MKGTRKECPSLFEAVILFVPAMRKAHLSVFPFQ